MLFSGCNVGLSGSEEALGVGGCACVGLSGVLRNIRSSFSFFGSFVFLPLSLVSLSMSLHSSVMESSQINGDGGEECNSNESGWTMYLGSPVDSDDVETNGTEGSYVSSGRSNGRSKNTDADYDSLTSDASTGPAQVKMRGGKEKKRQDKKDSIRYEHGNDKQEEIHTKLTISCDKKAGKTNKREEKTTRRGHNKKRSSSQTGLF